MRGTGNDIYSWIKQSRISLFLPRCIPVRLSGPFKSARLVRLKLSNSGFQIQLKSLQINFSAFFSLALAGFIEFSRYRRDCDSPGSNMRSRTIASIALRLIALIVRVSCTISSCSLGTICTGFRCRPQSRRA